MLKSEKGANVEQPDFSGSVSVSLQKNGYAENLHNSIFGVFQCMSSPLLVIPRRHH
jgi:hypothetical protein